MPTPWPLGAVVGSVDSMLCVVGGSWDKVAGEGNDEVRWDDVRLESEPVCRTWDV